MKSQKFDALVLAAGRGANDPMAQAAGISHKCLLPVAGVPMLMRVLGALASADSVERIFVSIENPKIAVRAHGFSALQQCRSVEVVESAGNASSSVGQALRSSGLRYPVLVTTADHALLTPDMIDDFCKRSLATGADLTAALATSKTVLGAYPGSARTFLKFSDGRYSGCNLFTFNTPAALAAVDFWQRVERDRKKPWRLVGAFGPVSLFRYLTGQASLLQAFEAGSQRLGVVARPITMTMAEAAIDVDKPADLELVERILASPSRHKAG